MNKQFMMGSSPKGNIVYQVPCVDVYPSSAFKEAEQSLSYSAVFLSESIWKPGSKGKITITFGTYGCPGCSVDGAWSHIGSNSNMQYPSMNLGFIDPPYESFEYNGKYYTPPQQALRNYCGPDGKISCESNWKPGATVIHEFCHALGMLHEHQNDLEGSNNIKLIENNVISYYNKIGLGEEGAYTNVIERYTCDSDKDCKYYGSKYDKDSIMLYALPDDWIDGNNPTYPNFKLSNLDTEWLKQTYPKDIKNYPELTIEFIDSNAEPWKKAWVKKIIKETFVPILGIKWIFPDEINTTNTTTNTTQPEESTSTIEIINNMNDGQIAGIVVGVIIILIMVILLGIWIDKNIKNK